jgi:uncharacterized protein YciI
MNNKIHKKDILINYIAFIINLKDQNNNILILNKNIMQFLLIAYDRTDPDAENRRSGIRPEHLKKISNLKRNGEFLFGGAILNDEGKMIGSMILYEFPDRAALDERLKDEPYVTEGVWGKIEINPFRLAKIE